MHESFNESTEMYLKTIRELSVDNNLIAISALARRLEVSTVSATEMVHRLEEHNLVEHTPYKGVQLTANGCQHAAEIIRSHRLWERFLVDHLNIPWAHVHDVACRLEHATDTVVTDALDEFLGRPTKCPHGNPIPRAGEALKTAVATTLDTLQPGLTCEVVRIHPESALLLEYLASHDVKPGRQLHIDEIAPFNGPIMITIGEQSHALGQEVATHIFVTVIGADA